jgi:cobalt-zinc-cadmium efflux system membrane fusion protein
LWLEVAAPERDASALRTGQRVRFRVPAFPKETFDARIAAVGGSLDRETRTLPVRASVENVDERLRPAMFATVLLEAGAQAPAISVPDEAVVLVDERPVVFVARPRRDGGAEFERRDVEIGNKTDGRVFLVGGVRPGEPVVVAGAFAVKSQLERSKLPAE